MSPFLGWWPVGMPARVRVRIRVRVRVRVKG